MTFHTARPLRFYGFGILGTLFLVAKLLGQDASLVLGNPSGAGSTDPNNFLIVRNEYVLSYNRSRGAPNWVTWHLSKSDVGKFNRETGTFRDEELIPEAWRVSEGVYAHSGYDLGHMCNSKDRSSSVDVNKNTFVMSNVEPQVTLLNRGIWKSLETYVRYLVTKNGYEAYIIAGCYGDAGRLGGQVTIPKSCFKVVVLLPEGKNDLRRINTTTKVIAVEMANNSKLTKPWGKNRLRLADVEAATGFHFLTTVKASVRAVLEQVVDTQ